MHLSYYGTRARYESSSLRWSWSCYSGIGMTRQGPCYCNHSSWVGVHTYVTVL